MVVSRYVLMYCFIMFDLPTQTKEQQREANRFRNFLLKIGCVRFQFSVYTYLVASKDSIPKLVQQIKLEVPEDGHVSFFAITERQYAAAHQFGAAKNPKKDRTVDQLVLF